MTATSTSLLPRMMKNNLSLVLTVAVTVVVLSLSATPAACNDAGTNFFLKATKSVPRIGRRSDNFFLKASKSVPRIGRRRTFAPLTEGQESVAAWPWYRTADAFPGPSRRTDADPKDTDLAVPLSWDEVEKAMEENPEMWTPELIKTFNSQKDDLLDYQRRLQAMANGV